MLVWWPGVYHLIPPMLNVSTHGGINHRPIHLTALSQTKPKPPVWFQLGNGHSRVFTMNYSLAPKARRKSSLILFSLRLFIAVPVSKDFTGPIIDNTPSS